MLPLFFFPKFSLINLQQGGKINIKGKIKLKLFFKSEILTCTHFSDEGWKGYKEFMLPINLNSDSQNHGQYHELD